MTGKLRQEIKQKKPFSGIHEEAVLGILRTADVVVVPMNEVLRAANLSQSQYNILRILRGAGAEGLPCGEISNRMVRRDPDLTRLLDKLETRELVRRSRGTTDRRVVVAAITGKALELLAHLDDPIEASLKQALSGMPASRLRLLVELLEEARGAAETE